MELNLHVKAYCGASITEQKPVLQLSARFPYICNMIHLKKFTLANGLRALVHEDKRVPPWPW